MWSARRVWAVGLALAAVSVCGLTGEFANAGAATPGYGAFVARVGGRVSTFSTSTNIQGRSILIGGSTEEIAMAPDGKTAYVTGGLGLNLIDTATDTVEHSITLDSPYGVAIAPDGKTAYVTNFGDNNVVPVNLVTDKAQTPITVGSEPIAIAVSPDGKTAYVADYGSDTVTPVNTATNTPGSPITVGQNPAAIAITPNGATAYVVSQYPVGTVTPVNLATNTPGTPIPIGTNPAGVAITPDGKTVYVTSGTDSVTPIDTATNTAGTPITVPGTPYGIAITPDGRTAYVTDRGISAVTPIDTATNTPGRAFTVGSGPVAIAITPGPLPVPPSLTGLKQSHATWRAGTGTTFSFALSEPARVTFTFSRKGRVRGTLVFKGHTGRQNVKFAGRVPHSGKLPPGRYRAAVIATNSAGQTSKVQTLTFTVVK
jgi:YVTN family beta-propeller protein